MANRGQRMIKRTVCQVSRLLRATSRTKRVQLRASSTQDILQPKNPCPTGTHPPSREELIKARKVCGGGVIDVCVSDTEPKLREKAASEVQIHPYVITASRKQQRAATGANTVEIIDRLHVVTYNMDGLDDNLRKERASEVCSIVLDEQDLPDAVLLQEVVAANEEIFRRRFWASGYRAMVKRAWHPTAYFTQIFVKDRPGLVFSKHSARQEFETSIMGRDCCMVSGRLQDEPILIATAHFESLSPHSDERKQQFVWLLNQLTAFEGLFVFGGDTNLREAEVKATTKAMEANDAWIDAGSGKDTRFTWDLAINTNKQMPPPAKPRARYDRIFFTKSPRYSVSKFQLLGTETISEGVFPSDHFGIRCILRVTCRKPTGESGNKKQGSTPTSER